MIPALDLARAAYEARFAGDPPRSFARFEDLPPEAQAVWSRVALAVLRHWTDAAPLPPPKEGT